MRAVIFGLVGLALVLAACGDSRPTADAWDQTWNDAKGLVPPASSVSDDMPEADCERILTSLRETGESLFPTPSEDIDTEVELWLEVAEGAFFECPPVDGGFGPAYEELDRIVAGVDASLDAANSE